MTRIAPIRYYQGRVAYPSAAQLRRARDTWDLDFGDGNRPTEDVDCTHIQRLEVRGADAAHARERDERLLRKFFDYVGYKRGFRVLTHETSTDSHRGAVTISHEIVYVIESRPTKGYVKLTLKSDLPDAKPVGMPRDGLFGPDAAKLISEMFDKPDRRQ